MFASSRWIPVALVLFAACEPRFLFLVASVARVELRSKRLVRMQIGMMHPPLGKADRAKSEELAKLDVAEWAEDGTVDPLQGNPYAVRAVARLVRPLTEGMQGPQPTVTCDRPDAALPEVPDEMLQVGSAKTGRP